MLNNLIGQPLKVVLLDQSGNERMFELPAGNTARVGAKEETEHIPLTFQLQDARYTLALKRKTLLGRVHDLPPERDGGIVHIVPEEVARHPDVCGRCDIVYPGKIVRVGSAYYVTLYRPPIYDLPPDRTEARDDAPT